MLLTSAFYYASLFTALGVIYSPAFVYWRFLKFAYILGLAFVVLTFVPLPKARVHWLVYVVPVAAAFLVPGFPIEPRWALLSLHALLDTGPHRAVQALVSCFLLYVAVVELWPIIFFLNVPLF
jgi:hypothetical protein